MATYTFKQRHRYPRHVFAFRLYPLLAACDFYNYTKIDFIKHNKHLRDWSAEKESSNMTKTKSAHLKSCSEMWDCDPPVDGNFFNPSLSAGPYPFHPLFAHLQENHKYDGRRNIL